MASKWLEERWEVLLPTLAPLGCAQEEQIKRICEAELDAWRQRPSLKQVNSLRKPLTETRNRIREMFPVTEDNGWMNPKSGEREHLALKYLNFSTEEWMQMNLPTSEELHQRLAHPLPLTNPLALLSKAEHLVQMDSWPEIVVGIGLLTGRGLVEVLHTGHFTEKSAYTVWFAGPITVYEQMCDPFEVPTLVRADLVLAALHRLRQFFNHHFFGVERHNISRQCSEQVREAVYRHLLDLVPLRSGERNVYKQLSRGVYSRLATLFYCPSWVDEIVYMATIQNHRKILEATSEEERLTLALAAGYRDYVVIDTDGVEDHRHGIRLKEPGVEVLSAFQENMSDDSLSPGHAWTLEEVKAAIAADPNIDDDWDEEDLEVLRLSLSTVILDKDGNIDQRRGIKLGEPGVRVLKVFQPRDEKEGEEAVKDDLEALSGDEKTAVTRYETQEEQEDIPLSHLLACLIFEIQVNVIENDPPIDILDTIATLIDHAPPSVMKLVEGLRRTPPQDQEKNYPSTLPSFESSGAFDTHVDECRKMQP